jgi:hypothetical protein
MKIASHTCYESPVEILGIPVIRWGRSRTLQSTGLAIMPVSACRYCSGTDHKIEKIRGSKSRRWLSFMKLQARLVVEARHGV